MSTSPLLLCHLEEEADALQGPPGLPMSYCAVPPAYAGVVEVPHEDLHSSEAKAVKRCMARCKSIFTML